MTVNQYFIDALRMFKGLDPLYALELSHANTAGGFGRAKALTPERRSEISRDAARRRWAQKTKS